MLIFQHFCNSPACYITDDAEVVYITIRKKLLYVQNLTAAITPSDGIKSLAWLLIT